MVDNMKPLYRQLCRYARSSFLRHVVMLLSGASLAQVVTVVATPVLSRIYLPKHFGIAALFLSLSNIFSTAAGLHYDHTIVLPETELEATKLAQLSMLVMAASCLLLQGLVLALGFWFPSFPWVAKLGRWLYLLPLSVLVFALSQVFSSWCVRKERFRSIAASDIAQSSVIACGRIGFGAAWGSSVRPVRSGSHVAPALPAAGCGSAPSDSLGRAAAAAPTWQSSCRRRTSVG